MRVEFKVPVKLGGHAYPKGAHEVPDSLEKDWYLAALIQNGKALIRKSPKKAEEIVDSPESDKKPKKGKNKKDE